MDDRERVRSQHRPARVKLLFVGESPPAKGGFFYYGSGILFSSTQRAFSQALGIAFATPDEFLRFFSGAGCFLEDLSHSPVDHLPRRERERALEDCVGPFAARLRTLSPELIVVFLKRIAPLVERAAGQAGIQSKSIHVLPFPSMGRQNQYVAELAVLLSGARVAGLMRRPAP